MRRITAQRQHTALMGPPIFIGGNCRPRATCSFCIANGAADFHRRKYFFPSFPYQKGKLQWGRRFSSAEMGLRGGPLPSAPLLQWGRRFSSAEMSVPAAYIFFPLALQWGRRFSSAEIKGTKMKTQRYSRLQWGRRFSSAEIRSGARTNCATITASMGPPIFIGGNRRRRDIGRPKAHASMGPPIFIGGNSRLKMHRQPGLCEARERWVSHVTA